MNIGIDASFLRKQNTGIGQVTVNFLKELAKTSSENTYHLYLEEDVALELPENFHKVIFLPKYKRDDLIRKIWWEKCLLPKYAKHDKCEVFFSLYQSTTIMPKKIEHIMLVHDIIPKLFPEYLNNFRKKTYWKLTERAIKKARRIICVSHRTEKDLVEKLKVDPFKVAVAYIDIDPLYRKEVKVEESEKVLEKYGLTAGYIYNGGGLEIRKNAEGVLRAYRALLENYSSMMKIPPLVVSGKMMPDLAPLIADVEKLVEILGIKDKVKLLGFVPQEDLPALYKNASVFLYPSFYEGFGIPVLEAMSQGTPVVTSKTSSLPEVGGDAVLYCRPDEIDDLAMVTKNVLSSQHLHSTLAERGKKRMEKFAWSKFVAKFLNIAQAKK